MRRSLALPGKVTDMEDGRESWGGDICLLWGGTVNGPEEEEEGSVVKSYPSHLRPVEVHRLQFGFVSSHFTRRILQVVHPVLTLGLLALFLPGNVVPVDP
jgi:hypothetical protein